MPHANGAHERPHWRVGGGQLCQTFRAAVSRRQCCRADVRLQRSCATIRADGWRIVERHVQLSEMARRFAADVEEASARIDHACADTCSERQAEEAISQLPT